MPVTTSVIEKAKDITVSYPSEVESARFDHAKKEFSLCVIDQSGPQKQGGNHFTVIIPTDNIVGDYEDSNRRFSVTRSYYDDRIVRKTINSYAVATKNFANCSVY